VKNPLKSKTIILAAIQAALGLLIAFGTEYPEVGSIVVAKSLLDGLLRAVTNAPIGASE
jgi:hypothetical protein